MKKEESFENKIIAIIESKTLETIAKNVGWHISSGIENSGFYNDIGRNIIEKHRFKIEATVNKGLEEAFKNNFGDYMQLENQVVSLELAKKLKELGVAQESWFYWTKPHYEKNLPFVCWYEEKFVNGTKNWEQYSAFTVAELWSFFPQFLRSYASIPEHLEGAVGGELGMHKNDPKNGQADYTFLSYGYETFSDNNPANACAKMLIYLIENNLTKNI